MAHIMSIQNSQPHDISHLGFGKGTLRGTARFRVAWLSVICGIGGEHNKAAIIALNLSFTDHCYDSTENVTYNQSSHL